MPNDTRIFQPVTIATGAAVAVIATVLPWYSFQVILPVARVVHIFNVTTTLWGFTTVAPIVIVVAAFAVLVLVMAAPPRSSAPVVVVIGLGLVVYSLVRCFTVPSLGVEILPNGLPAITQLEGGPFVELTGGLMIVVGAVGDLVGSTAGAPGRSWRARRHGHGSMSRPHARTLP